MLRAPSALAAFVLAAGVGVVAPAPAGAVITPQVESSCPSGSHEGCHAYEDMDVYLGHVVAMVEPMFDEVYGVGNRPAATYYVAAGQVGFTGCGNPADGSPAPYNSMSFMYCPGDRSVYVGQDQLWEFYSELGDAAPAAGYAHELGHHVQTIMGVPAPRTPQESVVVENQADCVAGAWLRYADRAGQLEYPDDVEDVNGLLQRIAHVESEQRTHGTLAERTEALSNGYDNGLEGCNEYFPATPIRP